MSREYTIFYYWDSVDDKPMPAYLLLCLETWKRHAGTSNIIRLGADNIDRFSKGRLTQKQMRLFSPAQRSDAATAVIMIENKGLFIDLDTILLPYFSIANYFNKNKPSMYAHMREGKALISNAFLAVPSTQDDFMKKWASKVLARIRTEEKSIPRKIRRNVRTILGKRNHVKWDYLGTSILDELLANDQKMQTL